MCGEFLLDIRLWLLSFFSFLSREFPSQIQSCLHFYLGSFSYTSPAGLIFTWGDSLRHPVLASFFCAEVLLHIPCGLFLLLLLFFFFFPGNFTYTSLADSIFLWGVSLTHPVLASCFLLNLGSFSYTSGAGSIFPWGVSLTHPMLSSSFFHLGSFTYTSLAGFIFISGVSLTHPVLALLLIWGVSIKHPILALCFYGEFLLHVPCWLLYLIWGVSLTHPVLVSFLSGEFLLHIPCCLDFYGRSFSYTC